jgi:leucyl aminopeptidase (aminopeptidase T)
LFTIGTEPTADYLAFEVVQAARKLVEEVMPVQSGESVVITADTGSDMRVVRATAGAVLAAGAHPVVVWYEMLPEAQMEPPQPVAAALEKANVWFEFGVQYILYTEARNRAIEAGCRHICLPGVDVDMLVRTIGRVNYPVMQRLGEMLRQLCQSAEQVRITDPNSTDLKMNVDKSPRPYPSARQGEGKGYSQMLGGQASFWPVVESINGTVVFDGAIWPPAEIGPLRNPVRLRVEGGYVVDVSGGPEAAVFARWLAKFENRQMYRIAHISFGFNPGVTRITGRIVEDERVFGCIDIGIGPKALGAPSHADGIILRPSVFANGTELEREGVYVHPELAAICRQLGVPGY